MAQAPGANPSTGVAVPAQLHNHRRVFFNRWCAHTSVMVALFPIALLTIFGISVASGTLVGYLHSAVHSGVWLPSQLVSVLMQFRPLELEAVDVLDVQLMVVFFFVCYASKLLLHHVVDIVRYLKISRRRLNMAK
ncbi:hypothetical protein TRVL_00035 [Trypanosoma vivax]|uniref:Uncharacterized protein n=1 Tax=Trypanosoma vivax (strain Y486) TaxID=1055687 RepID=G0U0S1_TRYVY|nr:hypothetical protein TRVL_00035 [Trypanosoma vivax]CCC49671.1 conserved hypothetical protein [Trypanosoma vivax Y486]